MCVCLWVFGRGLKVCKGFREFVCFYFRYFLVKVQQTSIRWFLVGFVTKKAGIWRVQLLSNFGVCVC